MEIVNGIMTAVLIILFLGIWVWAWSKKNTNTFEHMANLPLEDKNNSVRGEGYE